MRPAVTFVAAFFVNMGGMRMEEKQALRRFVHNQIQNMADRHEADRAIRERFIETALWKESQTIAVTISLPLEVDTKPLLQAAWDAGKIVLVPKVHHDGLTFHVISSMQEVEVGVMNILEPTTPAVDLPIDLCVVPGRVFDRSGYRVGWGGGYYDRFLDIYNGKTVALAYAVQIVDQVPVEPHDQAVEWIVSEREVIQCMPFLS